LKDVAKLPGIARAKLSSLSEQASGSARKFITDTLKKNSTRTTKTSKKTPKKTPVAYDPLKVNAQDAASKVDDFGNPIVDSTIDSAAATSRALDDKLANIDLDMPKFSSPTKPVVAGTPTNASSTSAARVATKPLNSSDIRPQLQGPMSLKTGVAGEYRYNPGMAKQNQSGIPGWKTSFKAGGSTPEEIIANNKKIEAWLIENHKAEFKNYDDPTGMFWRAETLGGSADEAGPMPGVGVGPIEGDLANKLVSKAYGARFAQRRVPGEE
jgi:hypothetical protein